MSSSFNSTPPNYFSVLDSSGEDVVEAVEEQLVGGGGGLGQEIGGEDPGEFGGVGGFVDPGVARVDQGDGEEGWPWMWWLILALMVLLVVL